MKKKINPLGLLSFMSLVCLLGPATGNAGWYGFLGFLYYLRYFWVVPDEGFQMNVRKAGSIAFLRNCLPCCRFCWRSGLL